MIKIRLSDIDFELSCKTYPKKVEENKLLTKSLREEGQLSPIILYHYDHNGKYIIIAGISRYISAKILGWKELDAVFGSESDTIKMDLKC